MKSNLKQPFNEKERDMLMKCPEANTLLNEIAPKIYTLAALKKEDYRIVHDNPKTRLICVHNLRYDGKGVKKAQYHLTKEGWEIYQKWKTAKTTSTTGSTSP